MRNQPETKTNDNAFEKSKEKMEGGNQKCLYSDRITFRFGGVIIDKINIKDQIGF